MENIEKYYENTKLAIPHENTQKFIEISNKTGNAIDLGCGTGRDTLFLIQNNWNVLAIDREDVEDIIKSKLDKEQIKKFRFMCQNFENLELEKNDLIIANFAIPFCSKNYFNEFWNKIIDSISEGRILCW